MKRRVSLLMLFVMISSLFLSACGKSNLVELKFPKFVADQMFQEVNEEAIEQLKAEEGVESAVLNEDGSITLKVTKEAHEEMIAAMKEQLDTIMEEAKTLEELGFIKDTRADEDYRNIDIIVNKEEYEKTPELGLMVMSALAGGAGSYQTYSKKDVSVNLKIVDEAGEELESMVYPDDFKDILGF